MGFVFARKTLGGDRVGEDEEAGAVTPLGIETLQEQTKFVVEHGGDALLADVAFAGAVNRITEGHVVGAHRLGDGAGGAADAEKPPGHFLPSANFGEGPVEARIQIDLQRLLVRVEDFSFHKSDGDDPPPAFGVGMGQSLS